MTPNPALALKDGKPFMAFGTPGGDAQRQATLQVFLNIVAFGLDPQRAVEAPRFSTASFPNSFEPHADHPGRLNVEESIAADVRTELAARGHKMQLWPKRAWRAGAVCAILIDPETGAQGCRRPTPSELCVNVVGGCLKAAIEGHSLSLRAKRSNLARVKEIASPLPSSQ